MKGEFYRVIRYSEQSVSDMIEDLEKDSQGSADEAKELEALAVQMRNILPHMVPTRNPVEHILAVILTPDAFPRFKIRSKYYAAHADADRITRRVESIDMTLAASRYPRLRNIADELPRRHQAGTLFPDATEEELPKREQALHYLCETIMVRDDTVLTRFKLFDDVLEKNDGRGQKILAYDDLVFNGRFKKKTVLPSVRKPRQKL